MGLIASGRLGERLRLRADTWYWRARYWWMDTDGGMQARIALACLAVLVVMIELIKVGIAALAPPPPNEPRQAIYWWVVQLIIAVVAAVIAYAMRPKIESPQQQEAPGPTVEDGRSAIYFWGTHWMNDIHMIAWKIVGRDKIKGKGGK